MRSKGGRESRLQLLQPIGLAQQSQALCVAVPLTVAEAAREQDRQVRPAPGELASEFDATHTARHHHVGEHQIDGMAVLQLCERRWRARHPANCEAEPLQHLAGQHRDLVIVFDRENPALSFLALGQGGRISWDVPWERKAIGARQVKDDARALRHTALDFDMSPGLLGEPVDLAEAETGAASDLVGREEGIEDPVEDGSIAIQSQWECTQPWRPDDTADSAP
jgi:hypothetical protein